MGRHKRPRDLQIIKIPTVHTGLLWRRTRSFRRLLAWHEIDIVLMSVYAQGLQDGLQVAYYAGSELLAKLVPDHEADEDETGGAAASAQVAD